MNATIKHIERKTDLKCCEDCAGFFEPQDGRPWKYEKSIWLCDDCEAYRMDDDDESEA